MDILEQVKELEKKSKESEIWKKKYEEFRNEVKESISKLNILLAENLTFKKEPSDIKIPTTLTPLLEEMYVKLKSDDNFQAGEKEIAEYLEKFGFGKNSNYVYHIRRGLLKMKGIVSRKEGHKVYIYYEKTQEHNEDPKIKFGKVSFLG